MSIKSIIKLFIPPIIIKIIKLFSRNKSLQNDDLSEKTITYNYIIDMNKRSKLPFTSIYELSKDYLFNQIGAISTDNSEPNFYGNFWTLERYGAISLMNLPPKNFSIQHGLITELAEYDKKRGLGKSFVWSKIIERKMHDIGLNNVITIGAPFLYADSLLTEEEIYSEKKRLGHNLLAFPMHSTHFIDKNYNPENFIKILCDERRNFDTVRVCLYWKDIQRGSAELYIKSGFEVVCAGHMFDQYFLQRQKSLFKIADATISNGVGSHIGYSIIENKPHYLIPDEFNLVDIQGTDGKEEMNIINSSSGYQSIMRAFIHNENYLITNEQRQIVENWWGVSQKKDSKEIKEIIYNCYTK